MTPQYRCPHCKRHLDPHWTAREGAASLGIYSMEPIGYAVGAMLSVLGLTVGLWQLIFAVSTIAAIAGFGIYRWYLRRAKRYYCAACDKVFRADYLRARAIAAQITRVAS